MRKNKFYPIVFSIVVLIILIVGYQLLSKVSYIEFQETEGFTVKSEALKRITNTEDVKFIKKTFRKSKKIPGIADVTDPDYFIKINNNEYYLWVSEDVEEGSIMKKNDSHTIYTIPFGPKVLEVLKRY